MATKITDKRRNKRVLVTGSKGFIGSHLMKVLRERGCSFDNKITSAMDVNNAGALQAMISNIKPKVIVHLAAVSNRRDVDRDPEQALKTNIVGTFNVLRIAKKHNIRVILASSAATYEPDSSLYAITKDCLEQLALMFDNAVVMRLYNVYGKGSKSVVNKFIKGVKRGKLLDVYGNTVRDYIYVDDVVEAIMRIIDAKEPQPVYEVGTGRGVTLRKLLSIIKKETGRMPYVSRRDPIKEIQQSRCVYPFAGIYKTTLEQGVRKLV